MRHYKTLVGRLCSSMCDVSRETAKKCVGFPCGGGDWGFKASLGGLNSLKTMRLSVETCSRGNLPAAKETREAQGENRKIGRRAESEKRLGFDCMRPARLRSNQKESTWKRVRGSLCLGRRYDVGQSLGELCRCRSREHMNVHPGGGVDDHQMTRG